MSTHFLFFQKNFFSIVSLSRMLKKSQYFKKNLYSFSEKILISMGIYDILILYVIKNKKASDRSPACGREIKEAILLFRKLQHKCCNFLYNKERM